MLTLDDMEISQGSFSLKANFELPTSGGVAVLGPSGAGKSTLLGAIGGFVPTADGILHWHGESLNAQPPFKRPIAHLFQDNNLFPHMTAAQNVGLGLKPSLRLTNAEMQRVSEALAATGLEGMAERLPSELSGGQQSRVALARVLVQSKPIVLLDEPFSALGPAMRVEMTTLARDVGTRLGALMLMVSHDLADAKGFADQVIWVEGGEALAPQSWAQIEASPPRGYVEYIG